MFEGSICVAVLTLFVVAIVGVSVVVGSEGAGSEGSPQKIDERLDHL